MHTCTHRRILSLSLSLSLSHTISFNMNKIYVYFFFIGEREIFLCMLLAKLVKKKRWNKSTPWVYWKPFILVITGE